MSGRAVASPAGGASGQDTESLLGQQQPHVSSCVETLDPRKMDEHRGRDGSASQQLAEAKKWISESQALGRTALQRAAR